MLCCKRVYISSSSPEMTYIHLRLSVPHPQPNHIPNTISWPLSGVVEYNHYQPNTLQSNYHESVVKKISTPFALVSSLRFHPIGALQNSLDVRKMSSFCKSCQSKVSVDSCEKQTLNEEAQVDPFCESLQNLSDKDHREMQRRRKIGLANKGRVPWNKGKKHTAETRVRIKQRTIEALRDPKVRKKMSEHSRAHSDQSKARMRFSLRQVWSKRLKLRQLKEKFFLSWSESITRAAKKGGSDQQELDWDSYDNIKQEIALQQLQWAADKAKAKEITKIRAKKAAVEKAEKMARLAQIRQERDEKAKARTEMKKARREIKRKKCRKSNMDEEELAVARGLKLKERLTKIHKKISISGQLTIQGNMVSSPIPPWEKIDIELIRKEKMWREVSLADQIQDARNKRAELLEREVLSASSIVHPSGVKSGLRRVAPGMHCLQQKQA